MDMETLFKQGESQKSQSPSGVAYSEGCEEQEELLRASQSQKENQVNLNGAGKLLTRAWKSILLASIFTGRTGLQKSQTSETRKRLEQWRLTIGGEKSC